MLSDEDIYVEDVMLRLRLRSGYPLASLTGDGPVAARTALENGLLQESAYADGRAVLTLRGRLLADAVIRELLT